MEKCYSVEKSQWEMYSTVFTARIQNWNLKEAISAAALVALVAFVRLFSTVHFFSSYSTQFTPGIQTAISNKRSSSGGRLRQDWTCAYKRKLCFSEIGFFVLTHFSYIENSPRLLWGSTKHRFLFSGLFFMASLYRTVQLWKTKKVRLSHLRWAHDELTQLEAFKWVSGHYYYNALRQCTIG